MTLHMRLVVGAHGFGFVFCGDHYEKFPQIGTVEIGDDVELGANTCVDRAAWAHANQARDQTRQHGAYGA